MPCWAGEIEAYGGSRRALPNWPTAVAGVVWTGRIIEMYRETMDQTSRDEITAAAAAHRELGPHYDEAVAESLVERIGEEIDRRVDARLGAAPAPSSSRRPELKRPAAQPEPRPAGRGNVAAVVLALGSMGIGIGVAATVLNSGSSQGSNGGAFVLVMVIWIVIGVINVAYARRH